MNRYDIIQHKRYINNNLGIKIKPTDTGIQFKLRCGHLIECSNEFIHSLLPQQFVAWIVQIKCEECEAEFDKMSKIITLAHQIYETL